MKFQMTTSLAVLTFDFPAAFAGGINRFRVSFVMMRTTLANVSKFGFNDVIMTSSNQRQLWIFLRGYFTPRLKKLSMSAIDFVNKPNGSMTELMDQSVAQSVSRSQHLRC